MAPIKNSHLFFDCFSIFKTIKDSIKTKITIKTCASSTPRAKEKSDILTSFSGINILKYLPKPNP